MFRSACLLVAGSLALYGSLGFVAPTKAPAVPEAARGLAAQWIAGEEAPSTSAWSPLAIGAAFGLMAAVVGARPALAADEENGEGVFLGNCAACHAGGCGGRAPGAGGGRGEW